MIAFLKNAYGTWRDVADRARTTIGKEAGEGEPSSEWKRRMLLCEHSPIRQLSFTVQLKNLLSWVSVHFVRHKYGVEHWVSSQRTDRTGIDRNELKQSELVTHEMMLNPQSIIDISRKRLCNLASIETREAWEDVLQEIGAEQPELVKVCVPDCIYRGHCYEYKSCGFHKTKTYKRMLAEYRNGVNE